MSLDEYFNSLIAKVESSDIQNDGKDENGFYKPTRALLLRHLTLLRDLHSKPLAQPMLRASWSNVVKHMPPEWLVLTETQKNDLKKMLG
jgi:hypothetical protein